MPKILEPPGFICDTKTFETYEKDLKRWSLLTNVPKAKQALMVLHYLDGHPSGIKEKIDEEIQEEADILTGKISSSPPLMDEKSTK